MLVKKYLVKDMPEAMTKIRQDLGSDAVILSSKKVKQRGFLGFFSVTLLEVVAAVNDTEPPKQEQPRKPLQTMQEQPRKAAQTPQAKPRQTDRTQRAHSTETQQGHALMRQAESVKPADQGSGQDVLKEVQELRTVLSRFLTENSAALPSSITKVRSELVENDLSPDIVENLILKIIQKNDQIHTLDEQEFRLLLIDLIGKDLDEKLLAPPIEQTSRVVAFVGPTGVGKTTSIAKIAALEFLRNKRKVGLITADTFRIAAVEQLKTYASILQLPIEVVFSTDEILPALKKLKECDLILLDTAGRNYGDTGLVSELNEFLTVAEPDETYLVLSMTTKSSDLDKIVGNFQDVPIDKLIFTKLDETNSYGAIYNLAYKYQKPLAYLTTGQNVPDDIEVASPGRIASLIVGDKQYV